MDLSLARRKYIFYLRHAFTRTVILSHSLTYKGPSEQREASFYSLTLPLIDAWISLSLCLHLSHLRHLRSDAQKPSPIFGRIRSRSFMAVIYM